MTTELATQNSQLAIPSALAAIFGDAGVKDNIGGGEKIDELKIAGKVWKAVISGEAKQLMVDMDGEKVPAPTVKVIILNQIPNRSYAMFEGGFDGENKSPICWSTEGVHPDSDVQSPVSSKCDGCPKRAVGSGATEENPKGRACREHKRIAVLVQHADATKDGKPVPLAMRLPVTSLWEAKESASAKEAQGWFAYDAYLKMLKARGIGNTAMVVTSMKFDVDENYPKVLFKYSELIAEKAAPLVVQMITSEETKKALGLLRAPVEKPNAPSAPAVEHKVEEAPVETPKEVKANPAPKAEPVQEKPKEEPKVEAKSEEAKSAEDFWNSL